MPSEESDARAPAGGPVDVRLLGEFRVVRDGGSIDPGGSVPRTLLGVLALSVGTVVQRDRLVDAAWGEDPPSSAIATLQSHMSRLRRLLEPDRDARDPSLIVGEARGYRLEVAATTTDVGRFRLAVRKAQSATQWQQAVELGAGELLPGCVESWPVLAERRAFREEWLRAVESSIDTELAEGRSEAVTAELERLVADHPLRERLWVLLMEALDASGRRSDALDAYQRARSVLVASAGVEPGAELKSAQRRVLSDADEPVAVAGGRRRGVPASRSPLLGRDQARTELVELLEQWRAVTLAGPGGVGKTMLAAAVGRSVRPRFPGGVIFADLTEAQDAGEVEATVATAVGVQLVGEQDDLLAAAAAQLQGAPTLLLVDNCEHVLPAGAAIIDRLLDEVDPLTVLATSRRPLGIGGERVLALEPLDIDAAVALFIERAAGRGGLVIETDDHVRQLCDHLDRLPLAIEIAAARADHLTVEEILRDATDRLDSLRRIAPIEGRHRSLDATIRWSYDLLDETEQAALRWLSVFRGSFDRDQAAGVLSDVVEASPIVDVLGSLVRQSLVVADRAGPPTRYRLLDTVRSFARQELDEEGEADAAQRSHRDWYLAWAGRLPAGASLLDLSQSMQLVGHRPDLLAALSHSNEAGDEEAVVDLAMHASGLTFCPAGLPAADQWLRQAVDRAGAVDEATRVDLLTLAAYVAMLRDDIPRSRDLLRQVVPLVEHHPGGVGPFALALRVVSEPGQEAMELAGGLLDRHRQGIRSDVAHDLETVLPWARLAITTRNAKEGGPGLLPAALEQADRVWEGRAWTDRRTFAGWTIHAGLLHLTGDQRRLRERLASMERRPERLGPPTYFMAFFEALADAADGQRDLALDRVRNAWQQHWRGIPGVASELLGVAAIVLVLTGDAERGRELLDQSSFRARHPGTAIVHLSYRRRLGLATDGFTERWWERAPRDELGRSLDDLLGL